MKKALLALLLAIPSLAFAGPRVYTVEPFQNNLATPFPRSTSASTMWPSTGTSSSRPRRMTPIYSGVAPTASGPTRARCCTTTTTMGSPRARRLTVIGNELTAMVGDVVMARAIDNDITEGKFGFGTYRASAGFIHIKVEQQ